MHASPSQSKIPAGWQVAAAKIVEELFPATDRMHWDALLELRSAFLKGQDWAAVLDQFLACRLELEQEHYLPFYRLRRLLTTSLRLEVSFPSGACHQSDLGALLRRNPRSLGHIARSLRRECFQSGSGCIAEPSLRFSERPGG